MAEPLRNLVERIVSAKEAQPDQSLSLMGSMTPDPKLKAFYARRPWLAPLLDDPAKLMGLIDMVHQRESRNSPGSPAQLYEAETASAALRDLYGINDYTPKGFMKYDRDLPSQVPGASGWQDPRPFAGDTIKGPWGQAIK